MIIAYFLIRKKFKSGLTIVNNVNCIFKDGFRFVKHHGILINSQDFFFYLLMSNSITKDVKILNLYLSWVC